MRSKPHPIVVELNTLMFANRIKVSDACDRAGIHRGTWSRWAAGGVPDLAIHDRLKSAVEEMIAEDEAVAA